MYKQPVDNVNRSAQIVVKDSCAGITLYPKAGIAAIDFEDFVNNATVRVELVRKSQSNSVLYTMTLKDLYEIWKGFLKAPKGVVIPFAFKDNLLLSKDSYLQLDITWNVNIEIDQLIVMQNTVATSTNVPISFKKIDIDGDVEIDTEHFEFLFIPNTIEKIETFIDAYVGKLTDAVDPLLQTKALANRALSMSNLNMSSVKVADANSNIVATGDCCCDHEVKRQKIEMDFNYMSYLSPYPTDESVLFKTLPNQKIKFFGEGEITLMQS